MYMSVQYSLTHLSVTINWETVELRWLSSSTHSERIYKSDEEQYGIKSTHQDKNTQQTKQNLDQSNRAVIMAAVAAATKNGRMHETKICWNTTETSVEPTLTS